MYKLEIKYKGNKIEDQIALNEIADWIPTLTVQHYYSAKQGYTTICWVVIKVTKSLIEEIKLLDNCTVKITELIYGKQSCNVDDFIEAVPSI